MRIIFSFSLIINLLFLSTSVSAQNFDETWKEFLENNKISNMSELMRPDRVSKKLDYAKYLLMNTNTDFCQSDMEQAEAMMGQINEMNPEMLKAIPGFVKKKDELEAKMKAYHTMDELWLRFLETRQASPKEMEAIAAAKTSCEKQTLAKYSYMTAHYQLCQGEINKAKALFENRTLRLAEKTSLRVEDVEGLSEEVRKMKTWFKNLNTLDNSWARYVKTGKSPGFNAEMPLFPCYPIPNIKALVLKGAADECGTAPDMLDQIKQLQADSGVKPSGDLAKKLNELKLAVAKNNKGLTALNKAWEAFVPTNEVSNLGKYGYEYCEKEPLIRAYVMDGFAYVCEMGEEMLEKIDALQSEEITELEEITMLKISELVDLVEEHKMNGMNIDGLWTQFVSNDDQLSRPYQSEEYYCDNIHQVKDWTMQGLSGDCEDGLAYLGLIEEFQNTFEFDFYEALECRVQKLRIKVWDCRYEALKEMASIKESDGSFDERLEALMEEYKIGDRPEVCDLDR